MRSAPTQVPDLGPSDPPTAHAQNAQIGTVPVLIAIWQAPAPNGGYLRTHPDLGRSLSVTDVWPSVALDRRFFAGDSVSAGIAVGAQINHSGAFPGSHLRPRWTLRVPACSSAPGGDARSGNRCGSQVVRTVEATGAKAAG